MKTLKVGDLKELLKNVPDNFDVVLSSDEEGNHFGKLFQVSQERVQVDRVLEVLGGEPTNAVVLWPAR